MCTVCLSVCEFISTNWITESYWLTIWGGCDILIYPTWQGLRGLGTLSGVATLSQLFWIQMNMLLTLGLRIYPAFANSVDPDQLASKEANWSGSALFVIKYLNLYEQLGSSYLNGWKLEVGVASLFIQQHKSYKKFLLFRVDHSKWKCLRFLSRSVFRKGFVCRQANR